MATRSIYLNPTADGGKADWTVFGAATDWQSVAKATRSPSVPSNTSGIRSSTNAQQEQFNFGTLAGLVNPGEHVNFVRVWLYFNTAVPANQTVTVSAAHTTSGLGQAETVPAGTSGWWSTSRITPFTNGGTFLTQSAVPSVYMTLNESATQAANTEVTAVYYEVGVSAMEHMVVSGSRFVGASTGIPRVFSYAQYPSVNYDPWMATSTSQARTNVKLMTERGLEFVRIFIGFGDMMTSATVVNEAKWVLFEEFLDMCVEENIRVDVTGLVTFNGPGDTQVPSWLDTSAGVPVLSETNRNLAFARWWKRCAQACAASPAVVLYCLINEPIAPGNAASTPDYYHAFISPGNPANGHSYGGYLCLNREVSPVRTANQVFSAFHTQMRTQIRLWDPVKPTGMSEHGTGDGFPNQGELAALGEVSLPHMYVRKDTFPPKTQLDRIRTIYEPLGKPIVLEEAGLLGSPSYSQAEVVDYYRSVHHRGHMLQGEWRNVFGSFALPIHKQISPLVRGKTLTGNRVAGVRSSNNRIGSRFI